MERDGWVLGMGDADLEVAGEACSLAEAGFSSSSIDIKRRVRGRSVDVAADELLLKDGEPLVGFMALVSRAQR